MADRRLGCWTVCGNKGTGFLDEVLQADGQSSIFSSHLPCVCLYIQLLALVSQHGRVRFRKEESEPLCVFVLEPAEPENVLWNEPAMSVLCRQLSEVPCRQQVFCIRIGFCVLN